MMRRDQAHNLRELARRSDATGNVAHTSSPPMIVVASGKGGVGASTIALELSTAMARIGHRPVLVEADLNRNTAVSNALDGLSILDVLAGRNSVSEVVQTGPAGIQVLPGAWAPHEVTDGTATSQQRLLSQLQALNTDADILVVDLGNGRNHFVRRFWQAASLVLMVSSADATAVMDSYAAIKALLAGDTSVPVYTLINFAADTKTATLAHVGIRETCRRFLGLRVTEMGEIPTLDGFSRNEDPRMRVICDGVAQSLCDELAIESPARPTNMRLAI